MKALPWLLAAALAVWGSCQSHQASKAREQAAQAALALSNEVAANDSTRKLTAAKVEAALALLGDSLQAVQRRAVQQQQRADKLDRALGLERIASAQLTATVRRLEITLAEAPVVEDAAGSRSGSWAYRETPYTVEATAVLPKPPAVGTFSARILLDPVPLQLRLGCSPANRDGIREASATLTGPTWAELSLGAIEQSPDLCQSPALKPKPPSRLKWAAIGGGVVLIVRQVVRTWFGSRKD